MNSTELLLSIELYKKQLDQVNTALESAEEKDRSELEELQLNLIQVLELTLSQIDQIEEHKTTDLYSDHAEPQSTAKKTSTIDDEFELFKHEISLLDQSESSDKSEAASREPTNDVESDDSLEESLKDLEGKEVRAPFTEKWGGHSYHNAVVLKIITDDCGRSEYFSPKVRVLYSHPTSIAMLPCRFFLEGNCRFDDSSCKFSHGKEVPVSDLRDYIPPDRDLICEGSKVLALHGANDIWHRGTVQDVLKDRSAFSFDCLICKEVFEVNLGQMIPLYADEDLGLCESDEEAPADGSAKSSKNHSDDEEFVSAIPTNKWLMNELSCKLGDWEKHTKGIGSKLMAKMGYVVGTGLGPSGDGRLDPVPVYAYPQGVSLDRCMELRLKSNGEDLYQVEKRLKRQQKIEMEKQKKQEENLHRNTSVFDIINNKLCGNEPGTSKPSQCSDVQKMNVSKKVLKGDSMKELNIKNYQLGSRIIQLQSEIGKLNKSKERQSGDIVTMQSLERRLADKRKELLSLQEAEKNIEHEQKKRNNVKKLTIF